jgi:hypothetical protein
MDVRRLRHSAIDDPALITAIEAAAAEAASAPELERLLRSRGWAVDVIERGEPSSAGQSVLDIRPLDPVATRR